MPSLRVLFLIGSSAACLTLLSPFAWAKSVKCRAAPQKIISLSLASDEIVFELLGESGRNRIAGLSTSSASPIYSNISNSVASITLFGTDLETIVRARPDLVISASYNDAKIKTRLEQAGICVKELAQFARLADISNNIEMIGSWISKENEAKSLAASLRKSVAETSTAIAKTTPVQVFGYVDGYFVAGRETLFDDIVRASGGENVTSSLFSGWKKTNAESLIKLKPDIIIATDEHGGAAKILENLERNASTKHFPAVKNKKIIIVPAKSLVSVSQHVAKAIESLRLEFSKHEPKKTP